MDYREETFGRSLRLYEKELADASALYQRAVASRRGRVVFIAGQPKSGRTDLLKSIGLHLDKEKPGPQLIAGQFQENRYYPKTKDFKPYVAAAGETLSLLAKMIPGIPAAVSDFAGQLLQTFAATQAVSEPVNEPVVWPEEIKRLARRAAANHPVVYLVDDLDESREHWLADLLQELATEIDRDLPLIVFAVIEGPMKLGEYSSDDPHLWLTVRDLLERGVAEWWPLHPLSRAEVAEYIGAARPGIAEHLHQVTNGYPRRVIELWRDWQTRGVVWWADEEDCWRWDNARRPTLNLVKDVIEDRLKNIFGDDQETIKLARKLLALGALEGEVFTAAVLAQALDWDCDELIDFIDDELAQSNDNPDGLLQEADSLEIPLNPSATRTLWRYRFAADLFWLACREYGFTETELPNASAALAAVLQEAYEPEVRLIAGSLARLYRNCRAKKAAEHYRRMWDFGFERESMRKQALLLLRVNKDDWSFWGKKRAVELLLEAAGLMYRSANSKEMVAVSEEAYRLASLIGDKDKQGRACYLSGTALQFAADFNRAREQFERGLAIHREIGSRDGEAACLSGLAQVASSLSEYETAREQYGQALAISREIGRRDGEAACLSGLADVARSLSEYETAREQYGQALVINRETGRRDGEATCLSGLAQVARLLSEYETVREQYGQALVINREIGSRNGEANCLYGLAEGARSLSEYETAREQYGQALVINREIGKRDGEAACLSGLAQVARSLSEYEMAREQYWQSLAICREIGIRDGEANCLYGLADVARSLSEYETAREQYGQALVINREIGKRDGEAACLSGLAQVARSLSEYETAREQYGQALAIFREIGRRDGEAACLSGLADVARLLSEYETAREQYGQALVINREIGSRDGEANCLYGLAEGARSLSEYETAREQYGQALAIFREIGRSDGEATCLYGLAEFAYAFGEYATAREQYEQALMILREIGLHEEEGIVLRRLGELPRE